MYEGETQATIVGAGSARLRAVWVAVALAIAVVVLGSAAASALAASSEGVSVSEVSSSSATLRAVVLPEEAATTYTFVYAKASESLTGAGAELLPAGGGSAGATSLGVPVSVHPQDLQADTAYHFELLVEAGGETNTSTPLEFTTQASGSAFALPDGRAWELVTEANKHGAGIVPNPVEGGLIEASESGSGITYVSTAPTTEGAQGNRSLESVQNIARRTGSGWSSTDIATRNRDLGKYASGSTAEYKIFSGDLATALVEPTGETPQPPLAENAEQEQTVYLRDNLNAAPEGFFTPLVTAGNVPAGAHFGQEGRRVEVRGASPDLSHVVLSSPEQLTTDFETVTNDGNLFEWHQGQLELVSMLPDNRPASEPDGKHLGEYAELGRQDVVVRNAISNDGSRVVWETTSGEPGEHHLYLRDMASKETIQLDAVQGGTGTSEEPLPRFQGASVDGSRIFFTDSERLTADSHAEDFAPELYVAEVTTSPLAVTVTDLSKDSTESATVRGTILGYSEDGSYVYYVAMGMLSPGAGSGPKLYAVHNDGTGWGAPRLLATLSESDESDWNPIGNVSQSSRVSPDGEYLAFMSQEPLTGYDNHDLHTGVSDQEVFVAKASTGGVSCVSCNPTGARPNGLLDPSFDSSLEIPLVDPSALWTGKTLAASIPAWSQVTIREGFYQPRYLSNSGRVYFDAADGLVPSDVNGKEDVYQYEPEGIAGGRCDANSQSQSQVYERQTEAQAEALGGEPGVASGCVALLTSGTSPQESVFLDASTSGEDVFVLTASQLSTQDSDSAYDIYDAHTCTGSSPCPSPAATMPQPCAGPETCRSSIGAALSGEVAASTSIRGNGNALPPPPVKPKPLTNAQKLAKALTACKKLKKHKKRTSCERTARKKYSPPHHSKRTKNRGSK
jgi:hypothetical protein